MKNLFDLNIAKTQLVSAKKVNKTTPVEESEKLNFDDNFALKQLNQLQIDIPTDNPTISISPKIIPPTVTPIKSKIEYLPNYNMEIQKKIANKLKSLGYDSDLINFSLKLAAKESSMIPNAEYKTARGLFQITDNTRKDLGYGNVDDPYDVDLQIEMFARLLDRNKKILAPFSKTHDLQGLLAAAHLGGPTGVKRWINKGDNPKDKLGTSIADYYNLFKKK